MSPRAAGRLEAAGFGPVYEYVAGPGDWLAADLPCEGTAQLAGMFPRRGVSSVWPSEDAAGGHPCFVVSEHYWMLHDELVTGGNRSGSHFCA
jgi:hypothetical protein